MMWIVGTYYRLTAWCCLWALMCAVAGCSQHPAKDVVAEVNDVPIYFYEMDAQRSMLFEGLSREGLPPDDETLRQQYGYALNSIIEQELIRQYLKRKNIRVDENLLVKEEALVQGDHVSAEQFHAFLVERGISPDLWHQMMQRRQDVNTFTSEVLRPRFVITPEEIEKYYTEHKDEFQVSEQWDFVYIEGSDKEKVIEAQRIFVATHDAVQARIAEDVSVRDVRLSKDRISEQTLKEISSLQPYAISPVYRRNDLYRAYVLREVVPAGTVSVGQTYDRIEQTLVEEKTQILLQQWLEKEFIRATVKVNSRLLRPVEIPVPKNDEAHEGIQFEPGDEKSATPETDGMYDVDFFSPQGNTESHDTETEPSVAKEPGESTGSLSEQQGRDQKAETSDAEPEKTE